MDKLKMHSPNLTQENIEKLAALFPSCVTEARADDGSVKRAIDFDQLKQELSDHIVDGPRERYQLNWPGKKEALLAANSPVAMTLRPASAESVNFETTKNLFIEGDNLDTLKLLQETYLNKIEMIFIDPPYNTGNDFIYDDDFSEDSAGYLVRSVQVDSAGGRLLANTESNGRFHSDWLSMMFSRLRLARNLLASNGLIFISIDDHEADKLQLICHEIFSEQCFIGRLIWKRRQTVDSRAKTGLSVDHEYILVYCRDAARLRGQLIDLDKFKNPDNDPRGPWWSADLTGLATKEQRPNLHYDLVDPQTAIAYMCPESSGWRYSKETMGKLVAEKRILWPTKPTGRPRLKRFREDRENDFTNLCSVLETVFTTQGTRTLKELFDGVDVMDFPKPVELMKLIIEQGLENKGTVLDFFAGSGTTAQAVMELNANDGGARNFILVQLPELCNRGNFATIADVAKERIRRAGQRLEEGLNIDSGLDIGFRVLKVDSSNMKEVYYKPDALKKDDLFAHVDNIKEDRTPEDLLFQVLLDWGVDLSLPIAREKIDGKTVFFVDQNGLAACFDTGVTEELVKKLASRKPLRVVFRDSGFSSDAVKINVEQIFKLLSPGTEVKAI